MTILYDSYDTENHPKTSWQQEAILAFHNKLSDQQSQFPCIPATVGHRLGQFRYGFAVDPTTEDAPKQLADFLHTYG